MANKFVLQFDAQLSVNQMTGAISTIQSALNNLKFPEAITKGATKNFTSLTEEIKKFQELNAKGITSVKDFEALEASGNKIIKLYEQLKEKGQSWAKMSGADVEKLFPKEVSTVIKSARDALKEYESKINGVKEKITSLNNAIKQNEAEISKRKTENAELQAPLKQAEQNLINKTNIQDAQEALNKVTEAYNKAKEAREKYESKPAEDQNASYLKGLNTKENNLKKLIDDYNTAKEASTTAAEKIAQNNEIIKKSEEALKKAKNDLSTTESGQEIIKQQELDRLFENLGKLNGLNLTGFEKSFDGAKSALEAFIQKNGQEAIQQAEQFIAVLEKEGVDVKALKEVLAGLRTEVNQTDARLNDVKALKSRIQYFFGLTNAINLAKRAIRSAFNTIKDLDKAMTETAVVTNFSVSDMWSQLPEYTKQANQLGVTTLDAYKAATLYYQQGLKTNEVNALSTETLKMARIAGLEAAEATDRMTNALRGFNMELTAANAQRVDDVYSELAANTASNVDEISTAMTKVASLANNANMEFETTAAFLAQIIETTRESAETAGTALKTVVARFSEVKKLVDEGSLKGQDEEGQIIDVNKVQTALRTAGIDMRKYFLGEVGLDDIFMELASKWDSLTTMQQRYIATQAAGSRQQSRFIAMMSDYARTQELVGKAYNSNGAAARQFEKTQESLESKLARLKNAWNEFLMGLANNAIVKGVVDLLILLLNTVNKVTGAFGEGVGFVLKWITALMAFKGLKVLFMSGGLLEKGLMGLTSGTALGKALTKAGLGATAGKGGVKLGEALFGGMKMAMQNVWLSFGTLGTKTVGLFSATAAKSMGTTAAAITGISVALAAVAAAAVIAGTAYQAWLKYTDKGHIKLAENYAEAMHKTADNLQQQANRAKEAKEKIEDYNNIIDTGATAKERNDAILAQNDYITQLLKQDATYAQYIQQLTSRDGQIYLTLDSKALAKAVDEIAKNALKASGLSDIADAFVASEQENYYNNLLTGVDLIQGTIKSQTNLSAAELMKKPWYSLMGLGPGDYSEANYANSPVQTATPEYEVQKLNDERKAFYAQIKADAIAAKLERQAYLTSAGTKFTNLYASDMNLNESQASLVAGAFGKSFDLSEAAQQLIEEYSIALQGQTRESLIAQYKAQFGETASVDGFSTKDLARSLAQQKAYDFEAGQQTRGLADLAKNDAGKLILEVFTGAFEGAAEDASSGKLKHAYSSLSEAQKSMVQKMLGTNEEDISRALTKLGNNFSNDVRKNFINSVSKSTTFTGKQLTQIAKKLTVGQQKQIAKLAENFGDYGTKISDTIVAAAVNNSLLENPDKATSDFLERLANLGNNPVLLLQEITQTAQNGQGAVKDLADTLEQDLSNNPAFSAQGQLQFFLTSDEFEKLNEQIEKFVEENNSITASNIQELAESSQTLNGLLENNVVTANGLANILNGLSSGRLGIFDLNNSLIDLYNDFYDVEGAADAAYATINNFKFGGDYTEAHQFIQQLIDKLKELQKTGQYAAMEKYLSVFFSEVPKGVENIDKAIKLLEKLQGNNGGDFWADLFGLKYQNKNGQQTLDFTSIIDGFLKNGGTNFKDYLKQQFQEKYHFSITDEFVNLMMQDLRSHDADVIKDIASAQVQNVINAYIDGLNGKGIKVDKEAIKQRIATIAQMYGLDPAELLRDYLKNNGKKGKEEDTYTLDDLNFGPEDFDFSNVEAVTTSMETAINNALENDTLNLSAPGVEIDPLDDEAIHKMDTSQLLQALGTDENGRFDLGTAYAKIKEIVPEVGDGTVTPQQWVDSQLGGEPLKLKVSFDYVSQDENGVYKPDSMTVDIEVGDTTQLQETVSQIASQAPNMVETMGLELAKGALGEISKALTTITTGHFSVPLDQQKLTAANTAAATLQSKLDAITQKTYEANVKVEAKKTRLEIAGEGQTITFSITTAAKGGIVKSFGSGGRSLEPGLALTGELGPEIVWNPEKGYAYLAGKDGPEINNLQPGERIFNNQETNAILKRSGISSFAKGGTINSYATDGVPFGPPTNPPNPRSTDKHDKEKKTDWRNELDWLYNLVADIAEYERKANIASLKYQSYLHDNEKTAADLLAELKKQEKLLKKAAEGYSDEYTKRGQELNQLNKAAKRDKLDKYVRYNKTDNTVEIDWDKINKLKGKDKDKYDKIVDYINRMESAKQKRDNAEQRLLEIQEQIRQLKEQLKNTYIDFEKRVLEAVVASRQAQIDNLSKLNDNINDVNDSILNSIQKEIELQRQIRDNTDTESNIADLEAQLAFLQRDTTGANRGQILDLEKQLKEAQQDYSDTLLDQSLNRLSDSNELAREQREKQIELMQAQLDYQKENGLLWDEVHDLMASAFEDGKLTMSDKELMGLLQSAEGWDAMTTAQRQAWADEVKAAAKEAAAYFTSHDDVTNADKIDSPEYPSLSPSLPSLSGTPVTIGPGVSVTPRQQAGGSVSQAVKQILDQPIEDFIRLQRINQGSTSATAMITKNGTSNFNIDISVGSLANDYDVDKLVKRVKEDIYTSAAYRNVNGVTVLR